MVIYLNTNAGENTAFSKWKSIERSILKRAGRFDAVILNKISCLNNDIRQRYNHGERVYIAGGGDGTVNSILNGLIDTLNQEEIDKITLGAIGLGSSNDFHKPFNKKNIINNIPVKIDISNTQKYDTGVLSYRNEHNQTTQKYWIINSSIGLTAEANFFFNSPDLLLRILKKFAVPASIIYAAAVTIFKYKNKPADIFPGIFGRKTVNVTNIGIVKNPNFSGNLQYSSIYKPCSGKFDIYIMENFNRLKLLSALISLSGNNKKNNKNITSYETDHLRLNSEEVFAVEYDGEVIKTKNAEFFLIPGLINICQ